MTYSGGDETIGVSKGVAENPEAYGERLVGGLFVGPATAFVGSLARANVTVKLSPFHPFVDSLSIRKGQVFGVESEAEWDQHEYILYVRQASSSFLIIICPTPVG